MGLRIGLYGITRGLSKSTEHPTPATLRCPSLNMKALLSVPALKLQAYDDSYVTTCYRNIVRSCIAPQ